MRTNKVRLIAGRWRGRTLEFVPSPDVRPTPDRARETLFNWLQPTIAGAHCLDLFAGSGALGFEAASRGAGHITLVDHNRALCEKLRAEAERFNADNIEVAHQDAFEFVANAKPFDILFLDPPFAGGALAKILAQIERRPKLLRDASLVYIESKAGEQYDVGAQWQCRRESKAGAVACKLYRTAAAT